jgi:uncharacterized integral membrane protein
MGKLILLLLIGGSLALFAASNLTPISLVILGVRTLALPLAVWVLGALLAGAVTTVLLSGFSSISKGAAVRRANQAPRDSRSPWTTARSDAKPESSPIGAAGFTAAGTGRAADRTRSADRATEGREARSNDDWDRDPESWDNWNEPDPGSRATSGGSRSEGRPRNDSSDSFNDRRPGWDEYENRVRSSSRRDPSAADSRTGGRVDGRADSRIDGRTDSRTDSRVDGRTEKRPSSGRAQPESRKGDVYDAEYRVLIPPYSTPANPTPPPPSSPAPAPAPSDEEDWGLDDEPQDRPR